MEHAHELIQKYLDDIASEAELAELQWLLTFNPEVAAEFARATRIDGFLRKRLGEERGIVDMRAALGIPSPVAPPAAVTGAPPAAVLPPGGVRPRFAWLPWAVAAALLLAVAGTLFVVFRQGGQPEVVPVAPVTPKAPAATEYQVVSGSVRVDGRATSEVHEGARIETLGDKPAVVRLPDGSRAELMPATEAVLHGPADGLRQKVELVHGAGKFEVQKADKTFRVDTGAGTVTVLGTVFTVDVQPPAINRELRPHIPPKWKLTVEVSDGRVEVRVGERKYRIPAREKATFTPNKRFDLVGKVETIEYREKNTTEWVTFSVAVPKGEQSTKRSLRLMPSSRGASVKGNLRGQVLFVWLDPDAPEQIYCMEAVPGGQK